MGLVIPVGGRALGGVVSLVVAILATVTSTIYIRSYEKWGEIYRGPRPCTLGRQSPASTTVFAPVTENNKSQYLRGHASTASKTSSDTSRLTLRATPSN